MNMIAPRSFSQDSHFPGTVTAAQQGVVLIVSDDPATVENLRSVCEFLELKIEVVSAGMDLIGALRDRRPMAVISDWICRHTERFILLRTFYPKIFLMRLPPLFPAAGGGNRRGGVSSLRVRDALQMQLN